MAGPAAPGLDVSPAHVGHTAPPPRPTAGPAPLSPILRHYLLLRQPCGAGSSSPCWEHKGRGQVPSWGRRGVTAAPQCVGDSFHGAVLSLPAVVLVLTPVMPGTNPAPAAPRSGYGAGDVGLRGARR